MGNARTACALAAACVVGMLVVHSASAQGRIVCWKDKSGKVIGCGDTVPPEYQDNAVKELDKRGLTRKTVDSSEEVARQRMRAEEAAKAKAEIDRRAAEQRRQDTALLATYASEQEIDGKRDRDVQVVDMQLDQLRASLKHASERQKDAEKRLDVAQKANKGGHDGLKEEATRAADEAKRLVLAIAAKEQDKDAIRARYADYRKRYAELKTAQAGAASKK
jgi:hypothetical protein